MDPSCPAPPNTGLQVVTANSRELVQKDEICHLWLSVLLSALLYGDGFVLESLLEGAFVGEELMGKFVSRPARSQVKL